MQIRAFLQLDQHSRRVVLSTQENERPEDLALKLAALALLIAQEPVLDLGSKTVAGANQEFKPDLAVVDLAGDIALWVECGNVSTNKIEKLARRLNCKILVLKELAREAQNLRRILQKEKVRGQENIEILAFPQGQFKDWMSTMSDVVEIYGEVSTRSFNLVCNSAVFNFEFEVY